MSASWSLSARRESAIKLVERTWITMESPSPYSTAAFLILGFRRFEYIKKIKFSGLFCFICYGCTTNTWVCITWSISSYRYLFYGMCGKGGVTVASTGNSVSGAWWSTAYTMTSQTTAMGATLREQTVWRPEVGGSQDALPMAVVLPEVRW